jgi:hypothetical protein
MAAAAQAPTNKRDTSLGLSMERPRVGVAEDVGEKNMKIQKSA